MFHNWTSNLYVPVDQVVVAGGKKNVNLLLPKGLFLIQHLDAENRVVRAYYRSVK